MDAEIDYITKIKTNPHVRRLELFLDNEDYLAPKGCPYSNVCNQSANKNYTIPYLELNSLEGSDISADENIVIDNNNIANKERQARNAMDKLFIYLEECRIHDIVLNFSEKQYFHVRGRKRRINIDDALDEISSTDNITEVYEPDIIIDKSGIDFDFDIYQKESIRKVGDIQFYNLVHSLSNLLINTLDLTQTNNPCIIGSGNNINVNFYCVILRKAELLECEHPKYGRCFKESFRYRVPGVKISKAHKLYLMQLILDREILPNIFNIITILNPWTDVLDPASNTHPLMFLGSAKRGAKIAHEFYKLYEVKHQAGHNFTVCNEVHEFDPIAQVEIDKPRGRGKKTAKTINRYKFNLCYELSVNYEAPNGLIKKYEFNPKKELEIDINTLFERSSKNLISRDELSEVRSSVLDLAVRNNEAKYLQKILDLLSPRRVATFEDWKRIIIMLARANQDYKPLAIWFSQRCPESWVKSGLRQLESIWDWALNHPVDENEDTRNAHSSIRTLYDWAKQDNPEKYLEIQDNSAFMKTEKMIWEYSGKLNDSQIAEILYTMFGDIFIYDETGKRSGTWWEFVFPDTNNGYVKGFLYKWREEIGPPHSLMQYITKKLSIHLKKIEAWLTSRIDNNENGDEEAQKHYDIMRKNLKDTMFKCGEIGKVEKIVKACTIHFRKRDFYQVLNTDPNCIGTGNGVLKLYPNSEHIQRYHEIPISRTTNVDFEFYDENNPYIRILEPEIIRLFAGEMDAYEYVMCYLASSLDGRKRKPLFFIWLGEGGNGKSFLLEMHIQTMRMVTQSGYAAKLNIAFFTERNRSSGGPDSEKMMLKHARFSYCSESEPGSQLLMSKIKEITSETLTASEKHMTQDLFEANCNFVFCSNYDPNVTGRDWGTWRRLKVYKYKMRFVENPDPNDRFQYKEDRKFLDVLTKDRNYKRAYFSILEKWYKVYRDKYNCNLANIPCPTIERETDNYRIEQDTLSRFIKEQLIYIGKYYPRTSLDAEPVPVDDIDLTEVAAKYIIWYGRKIDKEIRGFNNKEVLKWLKTSNLSKFIKTRDYGGDSLVEYKLLDIGEIYNPPKPIEEPAIKESAVETRNDNIIYDTSYDPDLDSLEPEPEKNEVNIDKTENIDISEIDPLDLETLEPNTIDELDDLDKDWQDV